MSFLAPDAGTYIYLDPLHAPRNRAMGLAGAFVVLPHRWDTPYTAPTPSVRNLFEDLGSTSWFPGHPWRSQRSWLWVFSSVDPVAHALVADDPDLPAADFMADYLPRYFMLNGRTGYFASHHPANAPRGRVGQPVLIRAANVGIATHSPHVHGNHVYVCAVDGQVQSNVVAHDTWEMPPLTTTDVLHPFARPPDAHPWPPSDPTVWTTDLGGDGHTGMIYPMHCHAELSLLANGGNYPQGLITHWALEGDLIDTPPPPEEPALGDPGDPGDPADPDDPGAQDPPGEPGQPADPDPPGDPGPPEGPAEPGEPDRPAPPDGPSGPGSAVPSPGSAVPGLGPSSGSPRPRVLGTTDGSGRPGRFARRR